MAPHVARVLPVERVAPEADIDLIARSVIREHFPRSLHTGGHREVGLRHWAAHVPRALRGALAGGAPSSTTVARRVADLVPDDYAVDLAAPDETVLVVVAGGSALG